MSTDAMPVPAMDDAMINAFQVNPASATPEQQKAARMYLSVKIGEASGADDLDAIGRYSRELAALTTKFKNLETDRVSKELNGWKDDINTHILDFAAFLQKFQVENEDGTARTTKVPDFEMEFASNLKSATDLRFRWLTEKSSKVSRGPSLRASHKRSGTLVSPDGTQERFATATAAAIALKARGVEIEDVTVKKASKDGKSEYKVNPLKAIENAAQKAGYSWNPDPLDPK